MTDQAIFLAIEGQLIALRQTDYDNEDVLQRVLAQFPELIAGVATSDERPRLLLVRREMPVTASDSVGLSLDHLFIDQAGTPVLVEVKRASDTRARREVVAQMLDYAANGITTWQNDLRDAVAQAAGTLDPAQYLEQQLGVGDAEAFWSTVEDNLRAGRIRLIFLADRLAPGLVRIIEFLNEQMRDVEVLGVELPQYTGEGDQVAYVPRVVGRTAAAVDSKQRRSRRAPWTEATLIAALEQREPIVRALVERLIAHVKARGGRFSWGSGGTAGVTGWYSVDGKDTPVWNINVGDGSTRGQLYFLLPEYASRHPVRIDSLAVAVAGIDELVGKVEQVRARGWSGWPSLPLERAAGMPDRVLVPVEVATDD
ncbi:hypothetical protein [Modestobacter sp. VKM Ac-2985]|uniref:hypothetical protein n=1 Tax=Modestobacter sp. VKM Ac-2985 TaxID=3004139 RepID=UPI0022AB8425|nr:hypothetical protein [Modestobacter sp. VKM Ac-2985]MCZ2839933.1 hypothetical protein [Modestobacter sp. VKM Ac-2985]